NDVFLMRRAFQKAQFDHPIDVAKDGNQAMDYFGNRGKLPQPWLVLLDLNLPGVAGIDILKWLRRQPGLNPIVIMYTSSTRQEDIINSYRQGTNAYLVRQAELYQFYGIAQGIKVFW